MDIIIKSFNGIGDLLFVTPTLKRIKEVYPNYRIIVNTNYPILLKDNPYVDVIGNENEGVFLGYPDPIHRVCPTKHHIESDWEIVKNHYQLDIRPPDLQPEIYLDLPEVSNGKVGIQVIHKGHWHKKKMWPYFDELVDFRNDCVPIPHVRGIDHLVEEIANFSLVVCSEGGIGHIAKAIGTPAVVIYGGFAEPGWNGYADHINLTNKYWCSYCYDPTPCKETPERKCMREIAMSQVFEAIDEIKSR